MKHLSSFLKHVFVKHENLQRMFLRCYCPFFDESSVRVRFAPSPTGFLHIGGMRTAMYNYLLAKKHRHGKFIVRIEDTDQSRIVPGAVESLLSTLEWIGMIPDESPKHGGKFGPYVQSERLHHYSRYANELMQDGKAYPCFCSQQRLSLLKRDQLQRRENPKYDNRCRHLTREQLEENLEQNKPFVIRLKVERSTQEIDDELFGHITHKLDVEGDPILLKSDGFPTYHLANVVDDHLMEITHVIRGKEWLISTPKHVFLYEAFGWKPPVFMHLPLLANSDGSKLSKRQGDVYVEQYRENGFSQSSLINFMAYYGSGFKSIKFPKCTNNHVLLLEQLARVFDPTTILQSDAIVDFAKLEEFSRALLTTLIESENVNKRQRLTNDLFDLVLEKFGRRCLFYDRSFTADAVRSYLTTVITTRKNHIAKLKDLVSEDYQYLWMRRKCKDKLDEHFQEAIKDVIKFLETVEWDRFDQVTTGKYLKEVAASRDLNFPAMMRILRMCLSGKTEGPKVGEMMLMLGKNETLLRFAKALSSQTSSSQAITAT